MTLNPNLEHRFDTEDFFWGLLKEDIIQLCLFIVSAAFVNNYLSLGEIMNMQKLSWILCMIVTELRLFLFDFTYKTILDNNNNISFYCVVFKSLVAS